MNIPNHPSYGQIFRRLNLDNDDDDDDDDGEDKRPITLIVDGCIKSYHNKERRLLHRTKMDQEEKRVYQTTYCSR